MKRNLFLGLAALAAFAIQQGCTVTYVEAPQPAYAAQSDPFPNATHIQNRINAQMNQIQQAVAMGSLDQGRADLVAQNNNLVGRFAQEDRADSNQGMDLTDDQTFTLDNMLNDNDQILQDAIRNRQAWNPYFQGGSFDYAPSGSASFDLILMDRQLLQQQNRISVGLSLNQISPEEAQEMRGRIQAIQAAKVNAYRLNGRFSLNQGQIGQLSWMTQDNAQFLHYRLEHRGHWDRQRFSALRAKAPAPMAMQHVRPGDGHHSWNHPDPGARRDAPMQAAPGQGMMRHEDRPQAPAAQAAPAPAPAPAQNQHLSMGKRKSQAPAKGKPAPAKPAHPKKPAAKKDSKDDDGKKKKQDQ